MGKLALFVLERKQGFSCFTALAANAIQLVMDGEIDAVANVATGAVLARAIEPDAGEKGPTAAVFCLNCAANVTGRYCGSCGQRAAVHRTLGAFWHDMVHSVIHFDGKIWRTLPRLVLKPGDLTRRYVHGERASFVSPLALFLFSVFLMFAALNWVGGGQDTAGEGLTNAARLRAELMEDRAEWRKEIADIEKEIRDAERQGDPTDEVRNRLVQRKAEIGELDRTASETVTARARAERDLGEQVVQARKKVALLEARLAEKERLGQPVALLRKELRDTRAGLGLLETAEQAVSRKSLDFDTSSAITGIPAVDSAVAHVAENPQLFLYKMQSSAYKYSWALILLSTPFMMLLFINRRDLKLFDHAIFVTYSISFMMILFIIAMVVGRYTGWAGVLALVVPVHVYKQLKYAYRLERSGAVWRSLMLYFFMLIVLVLFALLIIALGATG